MSEDRNLAFDEDAIIVKEPLNKGKKTENDSFYVIGIGASAGGLEALEQFFSNMPYVNNMAFIVIQHLSPDFKSLMPEILNRNTVLKVFQIQNGMEIKPGCIYLNPPKFAVTASNGRLLLHEQEQLYKINLTINTFLQSLASDLGERAIGIILSGTGSDGTLGCRAIKEAGGIVLAQDIKTAKFYGMPKSVIATNICDFVLPPSKMPEKLLGYTDKSSLISIGDDDVDKEEEGSDALSQIYNIINTAYSIDFSLYKQSTVLRCIDRRIKICQISSLEGYLVYLKENAEEVDYLYNSLLIGVTRFFRDKEAFEAIKTR